MQTARDPAGAADILIWRVRLVIRVKVLFKHCIQARRAYASRGGAVAYSSYPAI